jgi:hypothetical protein
MVMAELRNYVAGGVHTWSSFYFSPPKCVLFLYPHLQSCSSICLSLSQINPNKELYIF